MLDPLLSIEQANHLWSAEVEGINLWPLIRFQVLLGQLHQAMGIDASNRVGRRVMLSPPKWPHYLHTLPLLLTRPRPRRTALFWVKDSTRFPNPDGHTSFDRVHGEFYDRVPRPLIMESSASAWNPPPSAHHRGDIFSQDLFWLLAFATSPRLSPAARRQIDEFAALVAQCYGVPDTQPRLTKRMQTLLRLCLGIQPLLERYLVPHLEQRIALVTCSSQMGFEGLVVKPLHNLGFQVVEAQHGIIHTRHYAYQHSPECFAPDHPSRQYLPDKLLTYGDYWSEIVTTPSQTVAVGYPHLSRIVAESQADAQTDPRQILLLVDVGAVEPTLQLPRALAAALPDYHFLLKLHPNRFHLLSEYQASIKLPNVTVIGQADTYRLIAASAIVICAQPSTVLIEAAAYPGKRVFFGSLGVLPDGLGSYFENADHLIDLINDPASGQPQTPPEKFWAPDWESRFDHFITDFTRSLNPEASS